MSETIEKTFNVSAPARLKLHNIRGSVDIRPGEDGAIHVTAVKQTGSGDTKGTVIELSQDASNQVTIATRFPEGVWSWLIGSFPCRVDYIVQAPRQCSLEINEISSDTFAEGFEGEFSFISISGEMTLRKLIGPTNVKTVSGTIELTELTGELKINTVSGDISGKTLAGPLHLDTISGDVKMKESSLTTLEAATVSGELAFQTALGEGPYRFNSVSGNVQLSAPADSRFSAELQTISGNLTTTLPVTSQTCNHGIQTIEVQGGGVRLHAHSVSGDLSLAT